MAYKPTPYAQARAVSKRAVLSYSEIEVSLELENPADPDGDLLEFTFFLHFKVAPAEHDVGIMGEYIDDWFYSEWDGSPVPELAWIELGKIGAIDAARAPISKAINEWHEANLERALEDRA